MSAYSCHEESLSAYLDGEFSAEESKVVEEHLLNCRDCREALKRLQMISAGIGQIPRPTVNPALSQLIMSQLPSPFISNEGPLLRMLEIWGALSLLALGLVAVLLGPVLLWLVSVVFRHLEVLFSLVIKLSWQLPLFTTNLALGLVCILGAVIAFWGFVRIYSAFSREELIS